MGLRDHLFRRSLAQQPGLLTYSRADLRTVLCYSHLLRCVLCIPASRLCANANAKCLPQRRFSSCHHHRSAHWYPPRPQLGGFHLWRLYQPHRMAFWIRFHPLFPRTSVDDL